jgi:hypothetical protein
MSVGRIVPGANCPWGKLSMGRNVRRVKCPWGENVRGAKCPWAKMSWGELLWGELSWGKLSWAICLGASGPGILFPCVSDAYCIPKMQPVQCLKSLCTGG